MTKNYQQEYYLKNKDRIIERQKNYYKNNKEKRLNYADSYYQENKESILESQKERQQNKRTDITKYHNEYDKKRRNTDPIYKIRKSVSIAIYSALKIQNSSKQGQSVINYLPYTILELKKHLENQFEPWMNWNNHGMHNSVLYNKKDATTWKWNIDHIIPQSKFPYMSMNDDNFKKCWSLGNLRPLLSKTNLEKGNK